MNKIKALYDVVKIMNDKEAFNGILTAQIHKDESQLFFLENEFEKNLLTGQTKAKIATELNYGGNTVKHESNTELTVSCLDECRRHEWLRHLHHLHEHGTGCHGFKRKLSKLAFALSLLTALQIKEQEDKTLIISLNATDLPAEVQTRLSERISHAGACHHHRFVKEFSEITHPDFAATLFINKNNEVEKIVATFAGTLTDEQNTPHELIARVEVSFTW